MRTTRLALENLARRVHWWRLLTLVLCVASALAVSYGLMQWGKGYDLTPTVFIPWFR